MRRFVLVALAAIVLGVCSFGTIPTVNVTYHAVVPPGLTFPAKLYAKATITWINTSDPALVNQSVIATYDPTTGTATWVLPQNCQAQFECGATGLSDIYAVGTSDFLLNSVIPVTAPIVTPSWATALLPLDGSRAMTAPLPFYQLVFPGHTPAATDGQVRYSDPGQALQVLIGGTWYDVLDQNNMASYQFAAVALSQTAAPVAGMVATPTGTGPLTGPYTYVVTYTTAAGETEGGGSATCTTSAQNVQLTGIPTGPAGVLARNIYRTSAAYQYYPNYFVAVLNDNTTTTYLDTTADSGLGAVSPYRNTTGGWLTLNGERVLQVDHSGIWIGTNLIDGGLSGTNIRIGDSVGPQPGTAHQEIFIGQGAGEYVRNGAGDVAIGGGALSNATNVPDDSHRRTAIGINALFGAPGSSDTTAIGELAGIYATGTNGLYLGSNMGSNETRNGWLHIGNQYRDIIYGDITNGQLYINAPLGTSFTGGATFTGNVTAPNIGAPPDLTPYARKDTANAWPLLQTFEKGIQVGGQVSSDVAPATTTISGQGAYPNASTNRVGGDLVLSPGMGQTGFTVVDWTTLYGGSVVIYVDQELPTAATYMITEGIQYSAQTSNAVTATNLAAAINAWAPGVYATAYGAVVALEKAPGASNFTPGSYTASITYTTNLSGNGYLNGPWQSTSSFQVGGMLLLPNVAKSVNAGTTTLQTDNGVVYDVSGPAVSIISGGTKGRIILLRWTDTVGGLSAGAFTPAPGMPTTFTAVVGGWMVLFNDGATWVEQGRFPLGVTKTLSWYASTTSGGAVDTQYTLTIVNGVITGATP